MDHARKREIDLVLVTQLSRWGRSTADLRATIEDLPARQVAIRALNGPALDISTAQGKLMLDVLAAISELERNRCSKYTIEKMASGDQNRGWQLALLTV